MFYMLQLFAEVIQEAVSNIYIERNERSQQQQSSLLYIEIVFYVMDIAK